ncbi:flagellar basal body-associated FliL family protein [Sphingomonas sp.]|jgi:flagellar FliL protein|uniref:flagellar basal body-associated FliL family protein n=1 Tax=Sphingomonas sp. TaxID=28214 RepID=UPI0035695B31
MGIWALSEPTDTLNEEGEDGAVVAPPKAGKKKLLIIVAAAVLLLLAAGGGAFFFLGGKGDPKAEAAKAETAKAETAKHGEGSEEGAKFVDIPAMVVNIRSPDGAAHFLKVHVMLVPGTMKEEEIKEGLPLVLDAYQPFLRELRPEDLAGSAAVFRVKEELLVRTVAALGEGSVKDVLIQDLVQQ